MKKIGILTFHASHNYGSMLQAYALQTYLQAKGNDVRIINLRPIAQRKMYAHPFSLKYNSWKILIKNILYFRHSLNNTKKWRIFEDFMNTYYCMTEECQTHNEVETIIQKNNFDILISGGDQIWNQKCKDFEISFFLPFSNDVHKVAYAPSMGKQALAMAKEPYIGRIKEHLSQYDLLSVREPDAADMLHQQLGREVAVVADPVFLLSKVDYEKLVGKPIVEGKYMFYYTPSHIRGAVAYQATLKFSKQRGIKIVSSNSQHWQKDIISLNNSGPLEFLNLLYYADFVCGQSYHLAVFSLLFHKQFAVINGDADPRMVNLLTNCNIPHRGISLNAPVFSNMEEIDFDIVDNYVKQLKSESTRYLYKALYL